jgi:four helix bundle protein
MGDFRKLQVWLKAKNLAVKIYQLAKKSSIAKDFGFKDQIQRAAVSIPANIAEGDELGSDKQSVHHFFIAKGSSAELQTLIIIGSEIGYIEDKTADELMNESKVISFMLAKLISARSK